MFDENHTRSSDVQVSETRGAQQDASVSLPHLRTFREILPTVCVCRSQQSDFEGKAMRISSPAALAPELNKSCIAAGSLSLLGSGDSGSLRVGKLGVGLVLQAKPLMT